MSRASPLSIRARLGLAAGLVLLAFLSTTGLVLDRAFRASIEDSAREQLRLRVLGLLGTAELVDGELSLPPALPEPRFNQPGSGLYARLLNAEGDPIWTSRSEASHRHADDRGQPLPPGGTVFETNGVEAEEALYLYGFGVLWEGPEGDAPYTLWVSTAQAPFIAETRGFRRTLYTLLGGAGAALLALQLVVLALAMRPLRRVEREVERIERGDLARLEGAWPEELEGLTRNLNLLIDHERARQQRYRNTLDDLAHSLKTPLAILRNALADGGERAIADAGGQIDRMDTIVGHHLQRASVGSNPLAGARTPVAEAARRIAAGLERLHADRSLTIAVDVDEDIVVSVDERDLYEVLGNLLENACKYGEAQVRIRAEPQRGEVRLCVEDDGPGVPEALRGDVLARGARADTAKAGQGIGLAVVAELVAAYGGTLEIGVSDLGGAAVALLLPTAPGRRPAADQSESVSVSREESRPAASKLARKRIGLQQTAQSSK
jgi:two-component system sensor histidine kinase PhoQ